MVNRYLAAGWITEAPQARFRISDLWVYSGGVKAGHGATLSHPQVGVAHRPRGVTGVILHQI